MRLAFSQTFLKKTVFFRSAFNQALTIGFLVSFLFLAAGLLCAEISAQLPDQALRRARSVIHLEFTLKGNPPDPDRTVRTYGIVLNDQGVVMIPELPELKAIPHEYVQIKGIGCLPPHPEFPVKYLGFCPFSDDPHAKIPSAYRQYFTPIHVFGQDVYREGAHPAVWNNFVWHLAPQEDTPELKVEYHTRFTDDPFWLMFDNDGDWVGYYGRTSEGSFTGETKNFFMQYGRSEPIGPECQVLSFYERLAALVTDGPQEAAKWMQDLEGIREYMALNLHFYGALAQELECLTENSATHTGVPISVRDKAPLYWLLGYVHEQYPTFRPEDEREHLAKARECYERAIKAALPLSAMRQRELTGRAWPKGRPYLPAEFCLARLQADTPIGRLTHPDQSFNPTAEAMMSEIEYRRYALREHLEGLSALEDFVRPGARHTVFLPYQYWVRILLKKSYCDNPNFSEELTQYLRDNYPSFLDIEVDVEQNPDGLVVRSAHVRIQEDYFEYTRLFAEEGHPEAIRELVQIYRGVHPQYRDHRINFEEAARWCRIGLRKGSGVDAALLQAVSPIIDLQTTIDANDFPPPVRYQVLMTRLQDALLLENAPLPNYLSAEELLENVPEDPLLSDNEKAILLERFQPAPLSVPVSSLSLDPSAQTRPDSRMGQASGSGSQPGGRNRRTL